ncbi:hypothetical protein [Acaryochloris sp. CCMEE 5410]|uniref:hypothetical protein n=1 Tax=Acaryochloris sp. CCMEE 5410 TaxID=310037 RepID=UPI0002484A7D|nr:hypothetical protein [Acaryochloris sp. CCMEE 5410]KAI9133179.1 hypothetical protein ON05_007540 [Acaryochloris sp. CCMEE 5410]
MIGQTILTMTWLSLGMSLMANKPQISPPNPVSSTVARPPYNCFTREVWSPAKQAWCDRFSPHTEREHWPDVARPEVWESDRNRYTLISLDTVSRETALTGTDPKSIALSLVELPDTEGDSQKRTSVSIQKGQSAVVMMSQVGLADDSVQGLRYRFEFEPQGMIEDEEKWQLVWMGRQQLCWPGRGPEKWTNQPCL